MPSVMVRENGSSVGFAGFHCAPNRLISGLRTVPDRPGLLSIHHDEHRSVAYFGRVGARQEQCSTATTLYRSFMKLSEAIRLFTARADAGEIIDRKTGRRRSLSGTRRRGIISHVRNAVCRAAGADRDQVDGIGLDPYKASLVEVARIDAEAAGRASPRNEAANVALFLATVEGREYEVTQRHGPAQRRPATRDRVLPAWLPLYDALVDLAQCERQKRSYPAQLLALHDVAIRHGVQEPAAVPDDWDVVLGWVMGAGLKRKKFHAITAAFRKARELTGNDALPNLYQRVREAERGLRSLPDLADRLRARGCEADPVGLSTLEMIHVLGPKFARALERHLAWGREKARSPGWQEEQVGMTGRILASLIRLGYDPHGLSFVALFERPTQISGGGELDEFLADELGDDYAAQPKTVSLLRAVLDEAARDSWEHSPLWLVKERATPEGLQIYTQKVQQDLLYCFLLTRAVYGAEMGQVQRERWEAIEKEYERTRDHMLDFNQGAHTDGHKPKDRVLITWPQAVCIGLYALRRRALEARAAMDSFQQKRGTLESRTGRQRVKAFDEAMREYVLLAVLLDDGLRIQNYSGAIAGEHFIPVVERDASKTWIRFRQVSTRFRGYDDASVKLKKDRNGLGAERRRKRTLSPSIVDHELLFEYWTKVRPRDLVRRGLLRSAEEFDPDSDRFAVFIAPRTGGRKPLRRSPMDQRRSQTGQFTADQLSKIAGRTLHWVVRDVLGRGAEPYNVPTWDDPVRTREWRGVFAAHVVRLLLGTYLGGVRGDWGAACWLTNDSEKTLREHYNEVSEIYEGMERLHGIENVHHFDAVIDRMRMYEPGDDWSAFWDHFDRDNPTVALVHLRGLKPICAEETSGRHGRSGRRRPKVA